jgi:hypothetical protein
VSRPLASTSQSTLFLGVSAILLDAVLATHTRAPAIDLQINVKAR